MVISTLVAPACHRPLQALYLGLQSGDPGDPPLPQQPDLQAYLILYAGRYQRPWVVTGRHLGVDTPEPSGRRRRSSQRMCQLPSRFAIPDRTEFDLPSEFGIWPSHCAWKQGDLVGVERMSDTQCQLIPGGCPGLVQSTKSDTLGWEGRSLPRYPRNRA